MRMRAVFLFFHTILCLWSYVEDVRTFCANAANEDELKNLHDLMNESLREAA